MKCQQRKEKLQRFSLIISKILYERDFKTLKAKTKKKFEKYINNQKIMFAQDQLVKMRFFNKLKELYNSNILHEQRRFHSLNHYQMKLKAIAFAQLFNNRANKMKKISAIRHYVINVYFLLCNINLINLKKFLVSSKKLFKIKKL